MNDAVARCRQILAAEPRHADSLHLFSVIALQAGQYAVAVDLLSKLIAINGRFAPFHSNLGIALQELGRWDEAIAAYRRAVDINPDFPDAHYNLGNALMVRGRSGEAVAAFRKTRDLAPNDPDIHFTLGNALKDLGQWEEAVSCWKKTLSLKADHPDAHNNIGNALKMQGRLDDAVASYRKAIAIRANHAETHDNLGLTLRELQRPEDAVICYRTALGLKPDRPETYNNVGNALKDLRRYDMALAAYRNALVLAPAFDNAVFNQGVGLQEMRRWTEAEAAYRQAIALNPRHGTAHVNLGAVLHEQGRLSEAITAYAAATAQQTDCAEAYNNLGLVLQETGQIEEAQAAFRTALSLKPDYAEAYDALLIGQHYSTTFSAAHILAESQAFSARFERHPPPGRHPNSADPERRLRVGYVSGDFRRHSVSYFLGPVLANHSPEAVDVYCYSNSLRSDDVTARLREDADHWRDICGMSDDAAAALVAADGIDILVDLSGHTSANRLLLFARKPAPVQVTWLGYPGTTGLKAMDYRLVDAITDPHGQLGETSETLMRLDGGFLSYAPPDEAPEPSPATPRCVDGITFGSFNNPSKLSAATLDAWACLLRRIPASRLFLKGYAFVDGDIRATLHRQLFDRGVSPDRVELHAQTADPAQHLKLYERIDITLDPFPYNGTTTTCEALWMGVPVVTLLGERHSGRVGASLLNRLGYPELIAQSVEDYVDIAAALATDPDRLSAMHRDLRPRMAASPLCDGPAFVRSLESAYRRMWRNWCERRP